MTEVLANIPANDLRVYVVWLPAIPKDNRDAAVRDAAIFDDPRMLHYWDPVAAQGMEWNRKLNLPTGQLAWDIFIVLPRGATWKADEMPTPLYWSHQLSMQVGIKYDPVELRKEIEKALERPETSKKKTTGKDKPAG
ncbi:MAG: hypothetical protein U0166_25670 [Acidobacteriota bacterium]